MPKILGIKDGSPSSDYTVNPGTITFEDRDGSRTYYILADTLDDTHADIRATTGVPQLYALISGGFYVDKHSVKEHGRVLHPVTNVATILYELEVHYTNKINPNQQDSEQPPESRSPVIRWTGTVEDETVDEDVNGTPLQTTAGEKIIATVPVVYPVLEIKRYELYPFDPDVILDYSYRINSSTFWGAKRGSALMLPMECDEQIIEGEKYHYVTYRIRFKIRPDLAVPFKARILHEGTQYFANPGDKAANIDPIKALDENGNPLTVNLKVADGTKLGPNDPAEFIEFDLNDEADFNDLNLGPF